MKLVQFEIRPYNHPDHAGIYGQVFMKVTDPENLPISRTTWLMVDVLQKINGVTTTRTIEMYGLGSLEIYNGRVGGDDYKTSWVVEGQWNKNDPPPTNTSNLVLSSITVNQPESTPGAADARITINATSNYDIQYSINNGVTWQTSPTFTGLPGGLLQVNVKDNNPASIVKTGTVTIPVTLGLLSKEPAITFTNGNSSRWNAAFNPVVFTYRRRDLEVTGISAITSPNHNIIVRLTVNGDASKIKAGGPVYVHAGVYQGVFKALSGAVGMIVLDTPYIADSSGSQTGYINSDAIRPYYKVLTKITSMHPETGVVQTIVSTNRPDTTGITQADVSHFLQSLLLVKDDSDYTLINHRDNNLSASYTVAYAEVWDGRYAPGVEPVFKPVATPYYVLYAARQLGDRFGGNMAAYVPFKTGTPAKWITDFAEPVYSNTYPFDIGFIYGDDMAGLQLYREMIMLDINRQPLANGPGDASLLNEDSSWLLQQDGGRFLINRQIAGNTNLPEHLGLNRLLVNYPFPHNAYYFKLTLKYKDGDDIEHAVTQTQTVRIDKNADDNSVYLRWIGLSGSWNYYRFIYNQEVSLDVQNAVIIKNHITDWQNQQGIEEVISKTAGQKVKVIAEDLPTNDIKGLQSIKYSPKVQMLVSKNPVKWQTVIVNTATYSEYETRNGQGPFSIMFSLPAINIQTQ